MKPRAFVQRLEALAAAVDDEGAVAFAEQHYAEVAAQLTADERRTVGSIMHAARMVVAMKQTAAAADSSTPLEAHSASSPQKTPVPL